MTTPVSRSEQPAATPRIRNVPATFLPWCLNLPLIVTVALRLFSAGPLPWNFPCLSTFITDWNSSLIWNGLGQVAGTFDHSMRFNLDLNAVPFLKELTHLPIVVDPSHGTGKRSLVGAMALAGIAAGADGLMIESEPNPESAKCDASQTVEPDELARIVRKAMAISELVAVDEMVVA